MKRTIDLYKQYQSLKKSKKTVSKGWNYAVLLIVFALMLGAYGVKLTLDRNLLNSQNKELTEYVSNAENQKIVQDADALISRTTIMDTLKTSLEELVSVLQRKQKLTSETILRIYNAAPSTITVESIDFQSANVSISVISTSNTGASEYAEILRKLDAVYAVEYSGFTKTDSGYTSTFVIVLKGEY